jgi:hypothetical protein
MAKHIHVHLGRKPTADAEDGKWVTINGTHVMIGKGGKIVKGPAALAGKTRGEAHEHAAKEHEAAAKEHHARGDKEQTSKHVVAMEMHKKAASAHKNAEPDADKVSAHAETAAAATKTVNNVKPKPKAHEKLHQEAGTQVTQLGSKAHNDRHKELMGQYDKAGADWERGAINRRIEANAADAGRHHTEKSEQKARDLSAAAHKSGKPADHEAAARAIKHASHMHGQHGGVGYAKKQEELHALGKGHEAAVKAAAKPKAADEPVTVKPGSGPGGKTSFSEGAKKIPPKPTAMEAAAARAKQGEAGVTGAKKAHMDKAQEHHHLGNTASELKQREAHKAAATAHKDAHDAHGAPGYMAKAKAAEDASAAANKLGFKPPGEKTGPSGPGKPGTPGNLHDPSKKAATVLAAAKEAKEAAAKPKPEFGGKHMPEGDTPGHKALQHSQIAKAHHQQANVDGGVGDKKSAEKHRAMAAGHEAAAKAHLDGKPDAAALSEKANKQTATHHPEFGKTLYDNKDKKTHAAAKKMGPGEAAHAASAHLHNTKADVAKRSGDEAGAALHSEKAKHHEHIANNPGQDHSARGAKLQELRGKIDEHEKAKAKLLAKPKAPGKTPSSPGKASGGTRSGGKGPDSVTQATDAVKGLTKLIKKTEQEADPNPKKKD